MTLTSELHGAPLLRALNGISPEVFFSAAASVPAAFRVRSAARRIYRYYEPRVDGDRALWVESARLFHGPVDVRSFGRDIPAGSPCWRDVEEVRVGPRGGGLVVEVRAPSFVWGMVRKIVGGMREVAGGRIPLSRLEAAVLGRERLTLPLAEPEGLVLWDVEYPSIRWRARWSGPNRHQAAYLRRTHEGLARTGAVLASLYRPAGGPPRRGAASRRATPPRDPAS